MMWVSIISHLHTQVPTALTFC